VSDRAPESGGGEAEGGFGRAVESLASQSSRRGFLARAGAWLLGASVAGGAVARSLELPDDANAYYFFCGHTYTTGSCVHPLGLPRIDSRGFPIRPSDGHPVDNLGRPINRDGEPIGDHGGVLTDPDGKPLPPAPRTPICGETGRIYGIQTQLQGSWYRCCGGHVRKLWDCCANDPKRINGDAALHGYCYGSRNVFCVTYYQTHVPC
jgi:hypothetical protein